MLAMSRSWPPRSSIWLAIASRSTAFSAPFMPWIISARMSAMTPEPSCRRALACSTSGRAELVEATKDSIAPI